MSNSVVFFLPFRPDDDSYVIPKEPDRGAELCAAGLPIPPVRLLLGHEDADQFLSWGAEHAGNMRNVLAEAGYQFADGHRILDFGCGSGRLIRQFHSLASTCELWGVDVRAEHVNWCKRHLSPPFNFATTTTFPHLPFEDHYFNLIYAGSVFTHIDDLADAWFLELRRILKPGGFFYFTVHDNHSIELVKTTLRDHPLIGGTFFSHPKFEQYFNSDFGMFTLWRSLDSQVFYDLGYICRRLDMIFNVLATRREAFGFQTAILAQKR